MRYFDLHCDTMTECAVKDIPLRENTLHVSLEQVKDWKHYVQCYAVWLPDDLRGEAAWQRFLQVAEDAGFLGGLSRAMLPLTRRLFSTKNEKALEQVSVNLAANLCGMGGAATGAGVAAMRLLDRERYSQEMFFVVNCAGLQLLPSTVLSLRVQAGSADPFSVLLPALLSSLASLLLGVLLVRLFCRR